MTSVESSFRRQIEKTFDLSSTSTERVSPTFVTAMVSATVRTTNVGRLLRVRIGFAAFAFFQVHANGDFAVVRVVAQNVDQITLVIFCQP